MSWPINRVLGVGFHLFNRGFEATANAYARLVGGLLRVCILVLVVYIGILGITYWGFLNTPRGFIPSQDMGYLLVNIQLPDAASLERTEQVIRTLEAAAHGTKGINATVGIAGQSLLMNAYGSNFGTMFITLDSFDKRTTPDTYYEAIANKLRKVIPAITGAEIAVFGPPPVRGVGRAGGYMIMIEDRGDLGPKQLQEQIQNLVAKSNKIDIEGRLEPAPKAPSLLDRVLDLLHKRDKKGEPEMVAGPPALVGNTSVFERMSRRFFLTSTDLRAS